MNAAAITFHKLTLSQKYLILNLIQPLTPNIQKPQNI